MIEPNDSAGRKHASVVEIIEHARLHPAGALAPDTHQSYPIPIVRTADVEMAFLYCKGMVLVPKEGLQLWPPHYVAFLSARSCRFERLQSVTPADFGRHSDPADRPIGGCLTLAERSTESFLTKQARFYQAYDDLLPSFAASSPAATESSKRAAKEYLLLFGEVTEPPLLPYYQNLGHEFFLWLRQLAL